MLGKCISSYLIVFQDFSLSLNLFDYYSPYTCECSADGTGADFVQMDVTTNVPGVAGLSLAAAKDFDLVAQMPAYVHLLPRSFMY